MARSPPPENIKVIDIQELNFTSRENPCWKELV
jgi:hypothetical protein